MNSVKYTPGPWEWRGNQLYAPAVQSTLLRDVTFWNQDPGDKALIASASDMFDVLKAVRNCTADQPQSTVHLMVVRAITKVEASTK